MCRWTHWFATADIWPANISLAFGNFFVKWPRAIVSNWLYCHIETGGSTLFTDLRFYESLMKESQVSESQRQSPSACGIPYRWTNSSTDFSLQFGPWPVQINKSYEIFLLENDVFHGSILELRGWCDAVVFSINNVIASTVLHKIWN